MKRTTAKTILTLTFLILVGSGIVFWYANNRTKADPNLISSNKIDFESKEIKEQFVVEIYKEGDDFKSAIFKKSGIGKEKLADLSGFQDNITKCNIAELSEMLCLIGDVGAHSQNMEIFKVGKDKLTLVNFENGEKSANVLSDVPNFGVKDYNNDGKIVFYTDFRNYENDPLNEAIRNYYIFDNDRFVFDKVEKIIYHKEEGL